MPKFVIERQYLVPMYQHIVVEADNLEEACKQAIIGNIHWDSQEMDSDNAPRTTITNVKVIPDALELVTGDIILHRDRPAKPGFEVPGTASAGSSTRAKLRPARSSKSQTRPPTSNSPSRPLGSS